MPRADLAILLALFLSYIRALSVLVTTPPTSSSFRTLQERRRLPPLWPPRLRSTLDGLDTRPCRSLDPSLYPCPTRLRLARSFSLDPRRAPARRSLFLFFPPPPVSPCVSDRCAREAAGMDERVALLTASHICRYAARMAPLYNSWAQVHLGYGIVSSTKKRRVKQGGYQ